ncbi:Armadillo-type fold [Phytophthora cinnamomi]|uniref:Armadillo-type fold n=1 Tax=Phytophthora cinnamomi TaxID=4785 RepID=UPI0035595D50|nr:Armadillo-type fold [Phytophthora cinnamomi]
MASAFQSPGAWTPRKSPGASSAAVIPTMQRSRSVGQENAALAANASASGGVDADSRAAARRLRRQYAQQPIAQLEHHYHRQHQRPQLQTHSVRSVDGPPRLVASHSSRASAVSLRASTSRLPSKMELRRSEAGGAKAALSRSHGALGIPVLRSSRSAKVSSDGFSPSSSGHSEGGAAGQSTPYEQWRRLRRARTASGNSCASTSSTSSFASYVVNPNTGRHDFGLGSDDEADEEEEDEELDSVMDEAVEVEDVDVDVEDRREGLPSVLQHIIAPSLPPPPYPVDPYHFYCKPKRTNTGAGTAAAEVTSTLAALFADCGIEAIFHPLKCKFKCLKYVHYSHVEFVVRVYAHQRTLLVEFQRRSGSVLLWDGLYRILHQKLVPIIDATALPCSQSTSQKRVARELASASGAHGQASNQHTHMSSSTQSHASDHEGLGTQIWRTLSLKKPTPSSGVEAMKIMLTSRYLDAMREGCAGLAELTEDVQNSCLVAHADLVTPLVQAAEATDLSMSRCAVGALANIARAVPRFPENELALARRTAQQLRIQATPVVLAQLEHASERSLFSIELLRECARALGAFARLVSEVDPRSVAASSVNDERCLHVLRLHAKHRDAQLASHCRAALEQLCLNV